MLLSCSWKNFHENFKNDFVVDERQTALQSKNIYFSHVNSLCHFLDICTKRLEEKRALPILLRLSFLELFNISSCSPVKNMSLLVLLRLNTLEFRFFCFSNWIWSALFNRSLSSFSVTLFDEISAISTSSSIFLFERDRFFFANCVNSLLDLFSASKFCDRIHRSSNTDFESLLLSISRLSISDWLSLIWHLSDDISSYKLDCFVMLNTVAYLKKCKNWEMRTELESMWNTL